MNTDVIIIGAGVFGTSLAYHLSLLGKKVIVLEREEVPATHASGKNAGMFRQLYHHKKLSDWAIRSRKSWPKEVTNDFFKETSSVIVNRSMPSHHSEYFTEVTYDNKPAIFTKTDGLIDSAGYVNSLFRLADKKNAKFLFRETVAEVKKQDSHWTICTESKKRFTAPWLVNAAGAWINKFLDPNLQVLAKAFARHLFVVDGFEKNYMPEKDCGFFWEEAGAWYLRKWDVSSRLVSICDKEAANPDSFVPTEDLSERLANKLLSAIPSVAEDLKVSKSWHCFRTYTEDELPIWGEDPEAPGLFWLGAFGGYGMSTSFAATEDAARYINGENVEVVREFLPQHRRGDS